jgi:dTDP-4-dehydrorhamnose 3,5-epimerase
MKIRPLDVEGAFIIEPDLLRDDRGSFARVFCEETLREHGFDGRIVQCSVSYNKRRGTLRGMHFQAPPHEEQKLVRCTAGSIHDVVLDLRPGSKSFRRWAAVELSSVNRATMFVPKGCAHGFQTLVDDAEVFYQMTEAFAPASAGRVRFDDPAFGIAWPIADPIVSHEDSTAALWQVSDSKDVEKALSTSHGDPVEIRDRVNGTGARLPSFVPDGNLRDARLRFEREYICSVLRYHNGRMADAAQTLGIQRPNLYRKARQLHIAVTGPTS